MVYQRAIARWHNEGDENCIYRLTQKHKHTERDRLSGSQHNSEYNYAS